MKLSRRDFLAALSIGALGTTLGSCRQSKRIDGPNVLFIAIDDLDIKKKMKAMLPKNPSTKVQREIKK